MWNGVEKHSASLLLCKGRIIRSIGVKKSHESKKIFQGDQKMQNMTETFINYCNHKGIKVQQVDDSVYRLGFGGKHACFDSVIAIDEDEGEIIMETLLPVKVSPEKRSSAAEIVARLNSKFRNGFLEFSVRQGYLSYKTNLLLGENELQKNMVEHLIFSNWVSADGSFPVINAVLFGNISPQEAIDNLERRKDTEQKLSKEKDFASESIDISKVLRGRMGGFANN